MLQSVGLRTASIGPAQGARSMLLELPALVPPATGVLPSSGGAMSQPVYPGPVMPPPIGGVPQRGMPVPTSPNFPTMRPPQPAVSPATLQAPPPSVQMSQPPGMSPSATSNTNDVTRSQ